MSSRHFPIAIIISVCRIICIGLIQELHDLTPALHISKTLNDYIYKGLSKTPRTIKTKILQVDIRRISSVQMNKEIRKIQLSMPITSSCSVSISNSMGLQRYTKLNDLEAEELRSLFLHMNSEVPGTRSVHIQPRSITSVEELEPSEIAERIQAVGEAAARDDIASRKGVHYGECRKNHAVSFGGYAIDGCAEFMASGHEGTAAALNCAPCNCHRSFHRREVENETVCHCHHICG